MPYYKRSLDTVLRERGDAAHRRVCNNLLELRKAFRGDFREGRRKRRDLAIPPKTDGQLLLATWNIREFDSESYGRRSEEAMLYLAEIISRFDLVAVQEVRRSLYALDHLRGILGEDWQYIVTDLVEYRAGGNYERMAYLFDTRTVKFRGLAGELTLKPVKKADGTYESFRFARDPYVVGFHSGWFRFCLVTVHILWGQSTAEYPARVREINAVAEAVHDRAQSPHAWSDHHILLGDFNIFKTEHETFEALVEHGFRIPAALQELPSNVMRTKHYDQIAFMTQSLGKLIDEESVHCGVFDVFSVVFKDKDESVYADDFAGYVEDDQESAETYRMWRTHQISDHLPMWVQLRTDHAEEYLGAYRRSLETDREEEDEP